MLTSGEVDTLVGTGDGQLGISLLRTIINPNANDWSLAVSNLRQAKQASDDLKILATPWSPPASMKSNNDVNNGGKLLPEYYGAYAQHLNDYVSYMHSEGVTIDVVSVQNEPDWHPSYESCDWTGEELRNFVRDYGQQVNAHLLVGESLRFDRAYTDPSLNDESALDNFSMVGGHLYSAQNSGTFVRYPLAEQKNKERWMTEWLIHDADGDGDAIWGGNNAAAWNETLDDVLASVHQSMTINWNAYIWWWARRFYSFIGDGEAQYGTEKGAVLKRGWAFSQYSKYIRPGYVRVDATASDNAIDVTAYNGDNQTVIVILNRSAETFDQVAITTQNSPASSEAFVTSRTLNRAATAVSTTDNGALLETLPARSVVTLVIKR